MLLGTLPAEWDWLRAEDPGVSVAVPLLPGRRVFGKILPL